MRAEHRSGATRADEVGHHPDAGAGGLQPIHQWCQAPATHLGDHDVPLGQPGAAAGAAGPEAYEVVATEPADRMLSTVRSVMDRHEIR
jgi:hypothetical protein